MMNTQFKKGIIPWNKRLKRVDFPIRAKMFCIDCGKELSRGAAKYCRECHYKHNKGKENPRYKNGVSLVEHSCIKCGNRICLATFYKNGLCRSCSAKANRSKYKHKVSTKIKTYCKDCGQLLANYKATYCRECSIRNRKGKYGIGKDSPAWKGGLPHCKDCGKLLKSYKSIRCRSCSYLNVPDYKNTRIFGRYTAWKRSIFIRDEFTCQECGKKETFIQVHHIKSKQEYPLLIWDIDNGITLCKECHYKTDTYGKIPKNLQLKLL